MIAKRNELIDAAMELPHEDRAEIAQRLIDSLPPDWEGSPSISEEWISEVERRVQEIRNGSEKTIPHDEVVREIDRTRLASFFSLSLNGNRDRTPLFIANWNTGNPESRISHEKLPSNKSSRKSLRLPLEEREKLTENILKSLEQERADIDASWLAIAKQRLRAVERGESTTIDHDEVMRLVDQDLEAMEAESVP